MIVALTIIIIILELNSPVKSLCRDLIEQKKSSILQSQVSINNVQKVLKVEIMLQTVTVYRTF